MHGVLDGHQICFFRNQCLVDLGYETIGQLLYLVLCATFLIFGDLFFLERFLEGIIGISADIARPL